MKWFNAQKGYGFIQPTGGGGDVFVNISAAESAGLNLLKANPSSTRSRAIGAKSPLSAQAEVTVLLA